MPTFTPDQLRSLASQCLQAAAVPEEDAVLTARLLVEANLTGHDTHGVRQVPRYVELIREEAIVPGAPVTVLRETPTTAVLDGHHGLGFVGATRATELAIAKCRETRLSAVGVRNLNHVGRVGAYPEMVAAAGLVGLVYVNAQARGILVKPHGGLAPRMGTNPMGAGFPNPKGWPILLDFATSAVAGNKIRQAHTRGQPTGEGWIVRKDGTPTTNPEDFLEGLAMMLPLGGAQGHKGYALSVMVDLLSGVLAGAGTALAPAKDLNNGTFVICIDPEAFVERARYDRDVEALVDYLHATPTAPGDPPVMVPGEYEAKHRAARLEAGIELEPTVWNDLAACAQSLDVALPQPRDAS
ncbi:MAG: Ldh family oxidoreductase [SAR324 cluster bacterium]|nr:Ldh family oxidoreductase [SAR324 cluster bacterium]